jgi:hypothetical protein
MSKNFVFLLTIATVQTAGKYIAAVCVTVFQTAAI